MQISGEPTQKINPTTLIDNKQSKKVCNEGDPTKDQAVTMSFDYKEDFVETQTFTKTNGFTFNGNLKGRSALYVFSLNSIQNVVLFVNPAYFK